jgi:hypothetical protein
MLGLDQVMLRVKNQSTFGFVMKCKPRVCSLGLKKRMGLSWYHKCEFEVKPTCTNQVKEWLVQIETKMVHKQSHGRQTFTSFIVSWNLKESSFSQYTLWLAVNIALTW